MDSKASEGTTLAGKSSIYSKLPEPRSIRLRTIGPDEYGTIIQCELEVVNLDDGSHYEALSYVWGTKNPPVQIMCNNHIFEVTPNLSAALRRLRYTCPAATSEAEND